MDSTKYGLLNRKKRCATIDGVTVHIAYEVDGELVRTVCDKVLRDAKISSRVDYNCPACRAKFGAILIVRRPAEKKLASIRKFPKNA